MLSNVWHVLLMMKAVEHWNIRIITLVLPQPTLSALCVCIYSKRVYFVFSPYPYWSAPTDAFWVEKPCKVSQSTPHPFRHAPRIFV